MTTSRAARTAARRDEIVLAALACFEELGYEVTTIDDIRARSGASIGSIYHHFGSKDGVAAALYASLLSRYRESLRAAIASTTSAQEFIRALVIHHLRWSAEHPSWTRYLLTMRRADSVASIDSALRDSTIAFARELAELAQIYIERGSLRALPISLMSPIVLGPAQEVIRAWVRRAGSADELLRVAPMLADAAWRAVGDEPAPSR